MYNNNNNSILNHGIKNILIMEIEYEIEFTKLVAIQLNKK